MNGLFRVFLLVLVVPATFYFVFWVPCSLVPMLHELGLAWFISLGCAAFAGWYVWRKTENADGGMVTHIVMGAVITGGIGFTGGFFGPMIFAPGANQGPMLGLFITGPLGFLAGGIGGFIWWLVKRKKNGTAADR